VKIVKISGLAFCGFKKKISGLAISGPEKNLAMPTSANLLLINGETPKVLAFRKLT
jgi:hypothetical protein